MAMRGMHSPHNTCMFVSGHKGSGTSSGNSSICRLCSAIVKMGCALIVDTLGILTTISSLLGKSLLMSFFLTLFLSE